jgi:Electron transfer DM13
MTRHVLTIGLVLLLGACSGGGASELTGPGSGSTSTPTVTYTGQFHPVVHYGMGMVTATESPVTSQVQFAADFATQGGPALEVWLVEATDATDNNTVLDSSHVSLGPLQNVRGTQTYDIPADVDLSRYRAVTIWCVDAKVNFTTAPLTKK